MPNPLPTSESYKQERKLGVSVKAGCECGVHLNTEGQGRRITLGYQLLGSGGVLVLLWVGDSANCQSREELALDHLWPSSVFKGNRSRREHSSCV